ncbi:MAG: polymer-forming cytoskeletal protein [Agarilytica sp.]
MFGNKKNDQFAHGGHTLFDLALQIEGTVTFGGTLDVEGSVIGDIIAADGADALVRVREKGKVEGQIQAPKVIVNGTIIGDIYSSKHLELAANAVVNGNVHYSVIEMVKGAEVNGNLIHMEDTPKKKSAQTAEVSVTASAPQPQAQSQSETHQVEKTQ